MGIQSAFKMRATSRFLPALAAWAALSCLLVHVADRPAFSDSRSAQDAEKRKRRAASLERMRKRVAATKLYQLVDGKRIEATLVREPILRYDDQPRQFYDATLWVWTVNGRPVAVYKVEDFRPVDRDPIWQNCLASFSDGLISVQWESGMRWSSRKPGVEMKQIPKAAEPANSKVRRLLQMKKMSRRFSATMTRQSGSQETRMLPRPVYRYGDQKSTVQDAAIFAFTANGTNPDGLLILELRETGSSQPVWHYGAVGMTADALSVRLDGKEVWHKDGHPREYLDRLIYFFEKNTSLKE